MLSGATPVAGSAIHGFLNYLRHLMKCAKRVDSQSESDLHRQFTKRFAQRLQHSIWPTKLALPDDEYIPPCLLQSADRCLIPIDIGVEPGLPESGARLGERGVPAA